MSTTHHTPTIIEAPQEPSNCKPLPPDNHSKTSSSTQMSKSDPNQSSPTASVKSIEVGNLVITLKKDPLKALDSAILETSNSFYDDRLYQSASQAKNPQVSAWTNPIQRQKQPLAFKDLSRVQSFHPSNSHATSNYNQTRPQNCYKTQNGYHNYNQNIQHKEYQNESYSGQQRKNYKFYHQLNVDAPIYNRHTNIVRSPLQNHHHHHQNYPQKSPYNSHSYRENALSQSSSQSNQSRGKSYNLKKINEKIDSQIQSRFMLPEEVKLKIGMPPLKPQSAYRLFVQDKYSELKKANPGLKHHEISKKANEIWLYTTSSIDKEAYEHKYEECLREYRLQCEAYKKNKAKVLADYNANKADKDMNNESENKEVKLKFRTAYKLFKIDYVQHVREKYPDTGFKERAEILKNIWKGLPPHSKFLYVKRSRLDKKRAMLEKTVETILQVQKEKDSNIKPKVTSSLQPSNSKEESIQTAKDENKQDPQLDTATPTCDINYNKDMGTELDEDDSDDEDYLPEEEDSISDYDDEEAEDHVESHEAYNLDDHNHDPVIEKEVISSE